MIKKLLKNGLTDEIIIVATAVAAFFPWALSLVALSVIAVALLAAPRTRRIIFGYRNSVFLLPFVPVALIPPAVHRNWLGVVCGAGILLVFTLFIYIKCTITAKTADRAFDAVCIMSIVAAIYAAVEKAVYLRFPRLAVHSIVLPSNDELRSASLFGNPNLYSSVICIAILISVHMLIERKGDFKLYCVTIAANLIGTMLCGSLMGMIELVVGFIVMLALKRRFKLLAVFAALGVAGAVAIITVPQLLPRLVDARHSFEMRVHIWELAAIMFKKAPVFGRGILSYMAFSPDYAGQAAQLGIHEVRVTTNAHNIIFDGLLSFGTVGFLMVTFYVILAMLPIIREYHRRNRAYSSLAIAAAAGAFAHGMFDVTLAWPQVIVLMLTVLAAGSLSADRVAVDAADNHIVKRTQED